jgi:hypothetical protein
MKLEFHQLERRYEHLRVRHPQPQRQRKLLASLATSGQQTAIIVVAISDQLDRYLVIDGCNRNTHVVVLRGTEPMSGAMPTDRPGWNVRFNSLGRLALSRGEMNALRPPLISPRRPSAGCIFAGWTQIRLNRVPRGGQFNLALMGNFW